MKKETNMAVVSTVTPLNFAKDLILLILQARGGHSNVKGGYQARPKIT